MSASGRILIVDDDPPILEALSAALAPPYEVLRTQSGLTAFEVVGHERLDLVLLDYVLPDVSGLTILRAIKKFFPSILVIVMTGFGSEDIAVEAFRAGARDYLKKPIGLRDLLARVETLLSGRQRCGETRSPLFLGADASLSDVGRGYVGSSVQRAMAFIEAHLDWHLSLDQVAREAGMSKFHFCRNFKGSTGFTFREFLARRRIVRATHLLREGHRSVSEVYLDVGFKDLSHFGRVFRKITGQPPSRYRRIPG